MRRRELLAAVGASALPLAGCLGSATPGATDDGWSTVAVESVDDPPDGASLSVDVGRQFDDDRPAGIEVTYTSTANAERAVSFGASPPFSTYRSTDGSPRLVLVPDDHDHLAPEGGGELVPDAPVDGCWRVPGPFAVYGVGHTVRLSPGERISETYAVLGHHANADCLPAGEYRFEQSPYVGDGAGWGFSLRVGD